MKDVSSNPEFAKEFHESVLKGTNKSLKNEFLQDLLGSDLVNNLRKEAKELKLDNSSSNSNEFSSKNIFNDSISNYYSIHQSDKVGFTKFVNHSNGEELYVDDSKMATDSEYFTKTVADLSRLHMANFQLSENSKLKVLILHNSYRKWIAFWAA